MRPTAAALFLLPLLLPAGCINADVELLEIDVSGTVDAVPGAPVHLEFHHAERGEGALSYPLGWIDDDALDAPGAFGHELLYPTGDGTGLVVYGWQDLDGDGLLCAIGQDAELAGAVLVTDGVPDFDEPDVVLDLDTPCVGPERFVF